MRKTRAGNQLVSGGQIPQNVAVSEGCLAIGGECHGRPRPDRSQHVGLGLIGEIQHPLSTAAEVRLTTDPLDPPNLERLMHFLLRCDKIVNILQ